MLESELKNKTAKGLFWGGMSNGIQQLLNLFFGIFLARLLSPGDYGMVGMLTIFSCIAGSLQEAGFISALINRKEDRHEDYNAVFWFSISASLCIYLILFFCAPLIARFFHTPELTKLARYIFISFFISSFGISQSAYLSKHLMIKQKAIAYITALIISGTVGIIMAFKGFAYWGLATQSLVYVLVGTTLCWAMSPWRPSLKISTNPIAEMLPFSIKMLITSVFNHINNNIFAVILGRFYTRNEVGDYTQANKWNTMGHSFVSGMISSVSQPVLAGVCDDHARQLRIFRKMVRFTAFVSFPAMLGLSLIAPEFITIAITDKWINSAEILRILCVAGAFVPICNLFSSLLISKGKSNIYMWSSIMLGLIQLGVMIVIHPFGIKTMVVTYTSINIFWLFVWYFFVQKETGYRFRDFTLDILPFLFVTLAVMSATYFVTKPIGNMYFLLAARIAVATVLYILSMRLSDAVTFKEVTAQLRVWLKR